MRAARSLGTLIGGGAGPRRGLWLVEVMEIISESIDGLREKLEVENNPGEAVDVRLELDR